MKKIVTDRSDITIPDQTFMPLDNVCTALASIMGFHLAASSTLEAKKYIF